MTLTSVAERLAVVLSLPVLTTLVCPDRVSNPDLPHARWTDLVKVFTIQYISLWTLKSQCAFSNLTHKTKEKTTLFWQKRWFFILEVLQNSTYCHDREKASGWLPMEYENAPISSKVPSSRRRSFVIFPSKNPHKPVVRETSRTVG